MRKIIALSMLFFSTQIPVHAMETCRNPHALLVEYALLAEYDIEDIMWKQINDLIAHSDSIFIYQFAYIWHLATIVGQKKEVIPELQNIILSKNFETTKKYILPTIRALNHLLIHLPVNHLATYKLDSLITQLTTIQMQVRQEIKKQNECSLTSIDIFFNQI